MVLIARALENQKRHELQIITGADRAWRGGCCHSGWGGDGENFSTWYGLSVHEPGGC